MIRNISSSDKLDVGFDAWKIQENEKTALLRISLKPGESVEAHVNNFTVVFYVLSGSGDLTIDQETFSLQANDSIELAGGAERSWTVTGPGNLELLVVKELV